MRWIDKAFAELTARELYALIALRQLVFVVEQDCAYLDADGLDPECHHLWAETSGSAVQENHGSAEPAAWVPDEAEHRAVLAYLRIVPAGLRYPEVSLGRVITAPAVRGIGLGRELIQRGLSLVHTTRGPVAVRIGAQAHLERFYGEFGFVRASDDYDEDGIPHLEMLRAGQQR